MLTLLSANFPCDRKLDYCKPKKGSAQFPATKSVRDQKKVLGRLKFVRTSQNITFLSVTFYLLRPVLAVAANANQSQRLLSTYYFLFVFSAAQILVFPFFMTISYIIIDSIWSHRIVGCLLFGHIFTGCKSLCLLYCMLLNIMGMQDTLGMG